MPTRKGRPPSQDIIHIVDDNLRQGFAQMPKPVLHAKGLSLRAKVVYIALLDYAWQAGSCYPGQERLAADLDTSIDTVQRALAELRAFGLVEWKQQGLNRPNVYYLLSLASCANLDVQAPPDRKPQVAVSGNRKMRSQETATLRYEEYSGEKDSGTHHPNPSSQPTERGPDDDELAKLLRKRGVGESRARKLASLPAELVRGKVAEFDWRATHQPETVGKNPPGFLVRSILDPASYPRPPELDKEHKRREAAVLRAKHAAEEQRVELEHQAQAHQGDPWQRAAKVVRVKEATNVSVLRRPATSPDQLEQRISELAETFTREARAFFTEHPECVKPAWLLQDTPDSSAAGRVRIVSNGADLSSTATQPAHSEHPAASSTTPPSPP